MLVKGALAVTMYAHIIISTVAYFYDFMAKLDSLSL